MDDVARQKMKNSRRGPAMLDNAGRDDPVHTSLSLLVQNCRCWPQTQPYQPATRVSKQCLVALIIGDACLGTWLEFY